MREGVGECVFFLLRNFANTALIYPSVCLGSSLSVDLLVVCCVTNCSACTCELWIDHSQKSVKRWEFHKTRVEDKIVSRTAQRPSRSAIRSSTWSMSFSRSLLSSHAPISSKHSYGTPRFILTSRSVLFPVTPHRSPFPASSHNVLLRGHLPLFSLHRFISPDDREVPGLPICVWHPRANGSVRHHPQLHCLLSLLRNAHSGRFIFVCFALQTSLKAIGFAFGLGLRFCFQIEMNEPGSFCKYSDLF